MPQTPHNLDSALKEGLVRGGPLYCEVIILGVIFIITCHTYVVEVQVSDAWPTCDLVLVTTTKSCLDWIALRMSFKGPIAGQ